MLHGYFLIGHYDQHKNKLYFCVISQLSWLKFFPCGRWKRVNPIQSILVDNRSQGISGVGIGLFRLDYLPTAPDVFYFYCGENLCDVAYRGLVQYKDVDLPAYDSHVKDETVSRSSYL